MAFRHWLTADPAARWDHLCIYGTPEGATDGNAIVTGKYQEAQRVFLAGEWDVMIAIEDDMILPGDVFPRLLALLEGGADIGYGLYTWRYKAGSAQKWSAYTLLEDDTQVDANGQRRYNARSLSQDPEQARAAWGTVLDVKGVGMGVTAIKRHVLEAIPFENRGGACNDWYLAVDAQARGFVQRCDLGLVCGHMSTEPSPRILWPDVNEPQLFRVDFL